MITIPAATQECLPDSTGKYIFYVWLNQSEVSNDFNHYDLLDLINNSDKASPNDLTFLQNNIENAYKSFPNAKSEILKRTIAVKSQNKELDLTMSKLTDIIDFIEIVCYEESFLLNDPYIPNDYSYTGANHEKSHLELINATQAWGISKGNPSILIGITDTGIREDHEDLEDKIELLLHNSLSPTHGTFVAGCAAANTDNNKGIASIGFNSGIVFSSQWGSGNLNTVLQIAQIPEVKVINLSWGGCSFYQTHNQLYEEIRNIHDVLVVAGAGNHSGHCGDNAYLYPAAYESVISVTSVGHLYDIGYIDPDEGAFNWKDVHEHYIGDVSSTHHHNDKVNIAAPGYNVYSTGFSSPSHYFSSTGTSFAAPIVAGAAALVFSANSNLTANEVANIILSTADSHIYDIPENEPYIGLLGTGRLDAFAAVKEAEECTKTIVNTNEVWENEQTIFCSLVVKSTATLEIKDVLKLSKNANIIIEKGGKLTVNGGKLTSLDNHPWRGIYVEGDINLPQTAANQGTLILKNGAIIENARTAVNLSGVDNNWESNGGIVQANNAYFINNWRNVAFSAYPNPNSQIEENNVSYFTDVEFITNDQTIHNEHTNNVSMWSVKGVRFISCKFKDNRTNIDFIASNKARNGIYTSTASFYVSGSEFTNMKYGIYANSNASDHSFKVYNSNFNSYRGIYFNASDNVKILGNDFTVAPGYTYSSDAARCDETYGVYINSSSNFTIEDNDFYSSSNGSTSCGSVGIIARNTGSYTNELYRNDFDGFTVGIEALGINKGNYNHEGLELKCNRLDNGAWDFYVDYDVIDAIHSNSGIREMQGYASDPSPSSPAGNLFGNRSPILISNFVNKVRPISYFHHRPESESRVIPAIYSSNITLYEVDKDYTYSTSCPQRIHPKSLDELVTEKQDAQTHYEETSVLLQAHVDDGNTQLMTQQVEMAGEGDAYNTYQYLMQTSPYLSEEVLTSLGAKEEGFNNAMIRDVMVENPQAAKSEEVNLALDSRIDQLPAYMRWQINNGLYHFSEKEIMEQFIHLQKSRHDLALNEIIRGIIHQSEGFEHAPSLDELLAPVNDIRYQHLRAEFRFAQGDYVAGMQLLNTIAQQFPFDTDEALQAHQEKINFYTLLAQWDNDNYPGFTNLPEEVLTQLETYLEAHPQVAGKALSLLMLNQAIEYKELILYPTEEMLPKTDPVSGPDEFMVPDMDSELSFTLYPNPSRDYLTLDWCIESPRKAETGKIEIRNASGVLLHTLKTRVPCNQQILPLDGWESGTYTATIQLDGNMRKSITFVVAQ